MTAPRSDAHAHTRFHSFSHCSTPSFVVFILQFRPFRTSACLQASVRKAAHTAMFSECSPAQCSGLVTRVPLPFAPLAQALQIHVQQQKRSRTSPLELLSLRRTRYEAFSGSLCWHGQSSHPADRHVLETNKWYRYVLEWQWSPVIHWPMLSSGVAVDRTWRAIGAL